MLSSLVYIVYFNRQCKSEQNNSFHIASKVRMLNICAHAEITRSVEGDVPIDKLQMVSCYSLHFFKNTNSSC